MLAYVLRRLMLVVPTLFGIMVLNFFIVQAAPGGPVEQMIARLEGTAVGATERFSGSASGGEMMRQANSESGGAYRGARCLLMIKSYLAFDFGDSFFRNRRVVDLVIDKMPVSLSLGLWTTLLTYLVCIPLGIAKAVRDGSRMDVSTSAVLIVLHAIPAFLFALLLIVVFAGGSYFKWFPLRGLVSDNWSSLDAAHKVLDYFWHMALPIVALTIGAFTTMTFLTKNSFIEEIHKQYALTARAKGLTEGRVLYGHVFRNAMMIPIAGIPGAFIGVLFAGAMLVEVIFSLDGLGLLGFEAALNRDYPVMFGTLYFFGLIGLIMGIVGDMMYTVVDPRVDFEARR